VKSKALQEDCRAFSFIVPSTYTGGMMGHIVQEDSGI